MRYLILFGFCLFSAGCGEDDAGKAQCVDCTPADAGDAADTGAIDASADANPDSSADAAADAAEDALLEAGPDGSLADCLKHASGVSVADADLDGYPPYALDGCSMAYVASSGELLLRNLLTGTEQQVAPATEAPRRPSLAGSVLAWEADVGSQSAIRVRTNAGTVTVSGFFHHAREPRATADAVVLTGFFAAGDTSDSDVFLYDVAAKSVVHLPTAKGQQRFADVSASHVAWSDFSEDPSGVYSGDGTSLANIVLYDRGTHATQTVKLGGKQAFPMLAVSGRLGFLDWLAVHPVPKLQDYRLMSLPLGDLTVKPTHVASVQSEVAVRPSANAKRVEWVVRWAGKSTLYRAPLDGTAPPAAVPLGSVAEVHAPAGTSELSVVATRASPGAAPTLQALAAP